MKSGLSEPKLISTCQPASPGSADEGKRIGNVPIPVNWLYVQIRKRRLLIDRQPSGAHLFANTPGVIEAVRKLRNHDLRIGQPDQEGHQHG
jgi:hypothetical protein